MHICMLCVDKDNWLAALACQILQMFLLVQHLPISVRGWCFFLAEYRQINGGNFAHDLFSQHQKDLDILSIHNKIRLGGRATLDDVSGGWVSEWSQSLSHSVSHSVSHSLTNHCWHLILFSLGESWGRDLFYPVSKKSNPLLTYNIILYIQITYTC